MIRSMNRIILVSHLCVALTLFTGCGGSSKPNELPLSVQYQNVLKESQPETRARKLVDVALKQWKANDSGGLSTSLGAAEKAANEVADPAGKTSLQCVIAEAYAKAEQKSDAVRLLKEASKGAEQIVDAISQLPAKVRIAEVYGQALSDADEAKERLAVCEKLAATLEDPVVQANNTLGIALAYQRVQATDHAERTIATALQAARALADVRQQADVLTAAADTLTKMQRAEEAKTAFADAEQAAMKIEDPNSRSHALLNLAKKKVSAGQKPDAKKLLTAAEEVTKKISDNAMRTSLQEEIDKANSKL
jgi:tetratricopeptide (TPR) repeat protein